MRTSKPTGDAKCPPHVLRAHEIDDLMNKKAGSRTLDDEEIVDADDSVVVISNDDDDQKPPVKPAINKKIKTEAQGKSCGPIACRPPADQISGSRNSRSAGQDLLANISNALDPSFRQARNEEHSIHALQSSQIFTLSSQLREAQRLADELRNQLMEADRQRNAAERRADRAELLGIVNGSHHGDSPSLASSGIRARRTPRNCSDTHNHLVRQDIIYSDGGQATRWIGGSDDDNNEVAGFNDSPGTRQIIRYDHNDEDVKSVPHRHRRQHRLSPAQHSAATTENSNNIFEVTTTTSSVIASPRRNIVSCSTPTHPKVRDDTPEV